MSNPPKRLPPGLRVWRNRYVRLVTARLFFRSIPHGRRLGLRIVKATDTGFEGLLPYRPEIVGNPTNGVLHGGPITTLIDQTSGAAASLAVVPPNLVATLDLRLDYLRPAEPGRDIIAHADCYRVTRQIIFVRCIAHDGDPERPVAIGMSCFMRNGVLVKSPLQVVVGYVLRRRRRAR